MKAGRPSELSLEVNFRNDSKDFSLLIEKSSEKHLKKGLSRSCIRLLKR
jgi:hypothetical protein